MPRLGLTHDGKGRWARQLARRPGVPTVVIVGASITAGVGAEDPPGPPGSPREAGVTADVTCRLTAKSATRVAPRTRSRRRPRQRRRQPGRPARTRAAR